MERIFSRHYKFAPGGFFTGETFYRLTPVSLICSRSFCPMALGVTPFEFCQDLRHQKLESLIYRGVICVILRLAVSVEHRLVADGRTDRQQIRNISR